MRHFFSSTRSREPKGKFLDKSPFRFYRSEVGCLLIHGFTGTPAELRELGEYLASRHITVVCPLLPGHGTSPRDLSAMSWREWYHCVRSHYFELREACREVFVGGLSMGATLALHVAAHYPVQGLISLSGGVDLNRWTQIAVPIAKRFIRFRRKWRIDPTTAELPSYDRYPLRATAELLALMEHVKDDLQDVRAPLLLVHSKRDPTIPFISAEFVLTNVASEDKRAVELEGSVHVITLGPERARIFEEVYRFISEHSQRPSGQIGERGVQ